jgi:hypothetical protein
MPIILPILYKDDPKGLRAAERRLQKFQKDVGRTVAAGFAVAGLAAAKFGIDSVRAFAEAERAQLELQFAFEKFPQLADTNADALNRLNTALMMKTRFDDDAIASAQGLLASFQLTGQQITDLTPLLLDYAARTGRDLPSAAEALGKAMLGQGRALKEVGIDFKDTGSLAGNFDQVIAGLREQVGGFAEKDATTAAGKLEMLRNRFGEVQESVGEALQPALDRLLEWFEGDGMTAMVDFADWFASDGIEAIDGFITKIGEMSEKGTLVPAVVAGFGALTVAAGLFSGALSANPIGFVIIALGALSAQFAVVMASLDDFKWSASEVNWGQALIGVFTGWFGIFAAFSQNWKEMLQVAQFIFTGWINSVIRGINQITLPLQLLVELINFLTGSKFSIKIPQVSFVYNDGRSAQTPANSSQSGGNTRMAEGGLVVGPTQALIGEAGPEVVAPYDQFIETLGMSRGRGGSTYNVTVNAGMGTDGVSVGREIVKAIKRYERASGPVFAGA